MAGKVMKKVLKKEAPPEPPSQTKRVKKLIVKDNEDFSGQDYAAEFNRHFKDSPGFKPIPKGFKSVLSAARLKTGPNHTCKMIYTHWYLFQKTLYPKEKVLVWPTNDSRVDLLVPEKAKSCYDKQGPGEQMLDTRKTSSMPSEEEFKRMFKNGDLMR